MRILDPRAYSIRSLRALVRWDGWATSKVPLFLVCMYYAALSRAEINIGLLGEMAMLLLLLCICASFGYMVNDYSDRSIDRSAGKIRFIETLSQKTARWLVWLTASGGLIAATVYFRHRPYVIGLFVLCYIVAACYSLPPIRLKETPILGLAGAALAQRTLPAMILFTALETWDLAAFAVTSASTLLGLRWILVHQLHDLRNDIQSGVRTFAVKYGAAFARRFVERILFPLEVATLMIAVIAMSISHQAIGIATAIYFVWMVWITFLRQRMDKKISPASYRMLSDFYVFYWPVLLAILLALRGSVFIAIVPFTILWQYPAIRYELKKQRQVLRFAAAVRAEPTDDQMARP